MGRNALQLIKGWTATFRIRLERRNLIRAIEGAEGSWTEADVREWEQAREEAWAQWPTYRS
jgi:hypothetical protein